ncbi:MULTISPECIES: T3SS effector NleG family protein [Escherichia]|nr:MULTISPECIES: T3SS effector NleG family protein [Escherichia]EFJ2751811.1 DUF1076 domain-containing protein [Escherichia coli]MBB8585232.1 T3SS effector NleG family protein [Escherichia coli]MCB2261110.1 DUF1076 domain-containing protein [Escherichia albertii]MCB2268932.1 DUF1076 domain-containing protein [Escherichia albertii]MCB2273465.1 DUF1076 domain-containing protein [Escherichia albertii]
MPIILNLAQNGILAQNDILRIQESARQQTRDCMTIGHRQFVVQHIPFLNCFLVDHIPSGLLASLRRHQTANSMSNSLERQLNDGRTAVELFREHLINERNILMQQESPEKSLQNKVLSSAFIVDFEDKLIPHYALCCPVTLEIPVNGVFMRNSANSNVCSLYDKDVISQLISTNSLHPLSREPITVSMILEKSECYFSQNKDCFFVKSFLDNRTE